MSFLNNIVDEFTHRNQGQGYPSQSYGQQSYGQQSYGQPQSYNSGGGAPQVPPPWIAEWDSPADRWIFINRETGQRTFEHPYPPQQYGGGYGGGEYARQQGGYYEQQQAPPPESHTGRNVALAAGAGVLGGALLMHEGEKVEEKWDDDKYRMEDDVSNVDNYVDRKFDDGVQDVEDFPEDAARWTGDKVQEVEDIPQDIDRKWDHAVDDVEDVPEDVAGWAGRGAGDVERFDDNIDNAYDSGRNEARYDDY